MKDPAIIAAGRVVPDGLDRIRRYCGLPWSGASVSETWAWQYYDEVPTPRDNRVSATDVLTAAALHPGLSRSDLAFFARRGHDLSSWLAQLDPELPLRDADGATLAHLASAVDFEPDVSITLLSKVMHRKRPTLIPLVDRHIIDWYRPVTGERSPRRAWGPLLAAMRADHNPRRDLELAIALAPFKLARRPDVIGIDAIGHLGSLRAVDIAIWMGSR
jgi:hypothetical protein